MANSEEDHVCEVCGEKIVRRGENAFKRSKLGAFVASPLGAFVSNAHWAHVKNDPKPDHTAKRKKPSPAPEG